MCGRCALRLRQYNHFARERGLFQAQLSARSRRASCRPRQVHTPWEPETGSGTNARNAQKRTGPKTEEGKAKSRLNALQHGLGAIHVPLPHEDPNELPHILAGLMETYQPANAQEQMLVHNIASAYLRMQRASRF